MESKKKQMSNKRLMALGIKKMRKIWIDFKNFIILKYVKNAAFQK